MNIDDLAKLMGKSRDEVEAMLNSEQEITINLSDKKSKKESGPKIEVVD